MMNRRDLLRLSLSAALAPAQPLLASPRPAGSPKKGLGLTRKSNDWSHKLQELRCKWFYSWNAGIPADLPAGIAYTPMIWGYHGKADAVTAAATAAKQAGIRELLGFNEPDQVKQSNMTVAQALDAWPVLQQSGMRLGSPACVHPDREWMKTFMEEAEKRSLRVDFVCVHSYGSTHAEALVNRLHAIHKLYRKPIWITEFAVGDWKAKSPAENQYPPDKVLKFMEEILPRLDQLDFVERYAWFPARPDNNALGTSALWGADGKLTRLGECYRDH